MLDQKEQTVAPTDQKLGVDSTGKLITGKICANICLPLTVGNPYRTQWFQIVSGSRGLSNGIYNISTGLGAAAPVPRDVL